MTSQPKTQTIDAEDFQAEADKLFTLKTKITHDLVLREILDNLQEIVFRDVAKLKPDEEISQKIQIVLTVLGVTQLSSYLIKIKNESAKNQRRRLY